HLAPLLRGAGDCVAGARDGQRSAGVHARGQGALADPAQPGQLAVEQGEDGQGGEAEARHDAEQGEPGPREPAREGPPLPTPPPLPARPISARARPPRTTAATVPRTVKAPTSARMALASARRLVRGGAEARAGTVRRA